MSKMYLPVLSFDSENLAKFQKCSQRGICTLQGLLLRVPTRKITMMDETGNTFIVLLSYFRSKVRVSKQTKIIKSASVMEIEFICFSDLCPVTQNRHKVLVEFRIIDLYRMWIQGFYAVSWIKVLKRGTFNYGEGLTKSSESDGYIFRCDYQIKKY